MQNIKELSDLIKVIKKQMNEGKTYDQIIQDNDVKRHLLADIKKIKSIDTIEDDIRNFKHEIESGENIRKAAAKYGYGEKLTKFLISNLIEKDYNRLKKYEYVLKIETMWRRYKAGESIYVISVDCDMEVGVAENTIKAFNSSIKKRREMFRNKQNITDKDRDKLKESTEFSDDIIDYILTGKEIDFKRSVMEDEGRDEL